MSEIVNDPHAARFAAKLQPPRNPRKTLQCIINLALWHVVKARCHCCHRRIPHVEFADQRNFEHVFAEPEPRRFRRVNDVPDPLCAIFREADLDHLRQAISGDFHAIRIVAVQQHHAILRNNVEQATEAELDLVEILEDVRVVELNIINDHQLRQVMDKLRAFVEKCSVVFVAFDHEIF